MAVSILLLTMSISSAGVWVQETTSAGGKTELEVFGVWASIIAAGFAFLAVLLTIAFRYWDGRTHLKMTYHVERDQISDSFLAFAQEMAPTPPWGWPSVFFKLHNSGRTAVDVVATYLKAGERHINWPSTLNLSHPMHLDPLSIRVFAIPIHQLGEILELMGFTGKVTVTWAVRDSTGKTRNKKLSIRDVKEWAETMPAHGRSD